MRKLLVLLLLVLTIALYAFFGLLVDNSLGPDDFEAIKGLQVGDFCAKSRESFDLEVSCIKKVQTGVQSFGEFRCADRGDLIEPLDFIKRGYGCCFDRARFIEKALRYYGFETRHVYLVEPYENLSFTNTLPLGQLSHAASEVMTSRGWLGVDSNEPFLLLDEKSNPLSYELALDSPKVRSLMRPESYYSKNLDVIYGLYSRHGYFHGKDFPGPEFVFPEILWNFKED